MKVESVYIRNFKRFGDEGIRVSFVNNAIEEISNRFLILGDNGSGKTTILQAIALTLGLATRDARVRSVTDFDWIGFTPGRYQKWGKPRIELEVIFTPEELKATREVADEWNDTRTEEEKDQRLYRPPGESERVKLTLDGERVKAEGGIEELNQFRGRYYVRQLLKTNPSIRSRFSELPGVFWFDQFRSLGLVTAPLRLNGEDNGTSHYKSTSKLTYSKGVASLREYLNKMKLLRASPYSFLPQLEELYIGVFPGRNFASDDQAEPMPGGEDVYFLFTDGTRTYDLAEMSAGEQAVFPILYEFVRQQIAHSVVLIDEIDLNLHPPAAQTLAGQLLKIGPDCQFIFTTHSIAVSSIIGRENTHRLDKGVL